MIGSKYLAEFEAHGGYSLSPSAVLFLQQFSKCQIDNEIFLNLFLSAKMFNVILIQRRE